MGDSPYMQGKRMQEKIIARSGLLKCSRAARRLASITKSMVVPDTAAEKPLQGSRGDALPQGNRFDVFSFGATEQPADVCGQQNPAPLARNAIGEEDQKRSIKRSGGEIRQPRMIRWQMMSQVAANDGPGECGPDTTWEPARDKTLHRCL